MKVFVTKLRRDKLVQGEKLSELVKGEWRIDPTRLDDVDFMIVMVDGVVEGEFKIPRVIVYDSQTKRISFEELEESDNVTGLVGKYLYYETRNPSTIKELSDLKEMNIAAIVDKNTGNEFGVDVTRLTDGKVVL